jgi:hypothetical protein
LLARRISLSNVSVGVAVGVTVGSGLVEGVAAGDEQLDKLSAAIVRTSKLIDLRCAINLPFVALREIMAWCN